MFFFCHSILLTILIIFRNTSLTPLPANYPFPRPMIDPLPIFGILAGIVLSGSVAIFGWLGAAGKEGLKVRPFSQMMQVRLKR